MTKIWEVLDRRELLTVENRLRVFQEHVRLPDGREIPDYLQFSTQPYVVIVAETPGGSIICERQYKHGPKKIILTLPAGIIEPGEPPEQAAQRELLEETGYSAATWQALGEFVTNGNAGGGRCYTFLARDCRKVAEPDNRDLEEIIIELKRPDEVLAALFASQMPLMSDAAALLPALIRIGYLESP
jgi:ADP-ribose pyrophosphatase